MAGVNDLLRELHRLRRHIRDLETELTRTPKLLTAHQAKLAKQEDDYKAAVEGLKKLKVKTHEQETTLKSTIAQLRKFEAQLNDTQNKKEYDGKQSEINQAKDRIAQLENDILEALGTIDDRTAALPEHIKQLEAARAGFATTQKELAERVLRWQADKQTALSTVQTTEKLLSPTIKPHYDRIVNKYGPEGFALAEQMTCSFCHTSLTQQMMNEVRAGQFVCCQSCGRMLYVLPEPVVAN
jgi:predicted  nucleic acid-binding Zn-ribbon protein